MKWFWGILLILVVAVVAAIRYLPWWGVLVLVLTLLVSAPSVGRLMLAQFIRKVGRDLATGLQGATLTQASKPIRPQPPPNREALEEMLDGESDESDGDSDDAFGDPDEGPAGAMRDDPPESWNWYELEITITPRPIEDEDYPGWNAEALNVVPAGTRPGEISDQCLVVNREYEHEGRFERADRRTFSEGARLRLLTGVRPGRADCSSVIGSYAIWGSHRVASAWHRVAGMRLCFLKCRRFRYGL